MKPLTTERTIDDKDKKIISLVKHGLTVKEICREVNLSKRGVDNRLEVMRRYYNCASTTQLVVFLMDEGLL